MDKFDNIIIQLSISRPPKLPVSTDINSERFNWLVVMDAESLEDPDSSNYSLYIIHNSLI